MVDQTFVGVAGIVGSPAGGPLPATARRLLADLNFQFLELGLTGEKVRDPRFDWHEEVRGRLIETDHATRLRLADTPFALFRLALPAEAELHAGLRVADTTGPEPAGSWAGRCTSFVQQAVFAASRILDNAPLAAALALGLSESDECRLREATPSSLAALARTPNLVAPRWPSQRRFWETLVAAARQPTPVTLQWTLCMGLCLLGSDDGGVPSAGHPAVGRRHGRR